MPNTTRYGINAPAAGHTLKIAVVSDLHDNAGDDVTALLKEISPDIILIPGDIIETNIFGLKQRIKNDYQIYLKKCGKDPTDPRF